jgi:type IV pilus assembly protein PilM
MEFFALDIGAVSSKIVQLKKNGKNYQLRAAIQFPTPLTGISSETESNLLVMAEAIKKAVKEAQIRTSYLVASLPESEVFTRIVYMPKLTESELKSAITWEAEQNIPLPITDVNYSYSIADVKNDGSMEILIIAAPKRLIERYEKLFRLCNYVPLALETGLLAAARSLSDEKQRDPTMLIVLGARATEIGIVKHGDLLFTRTISTAGEALTRAVITGLQIDAEQAESYKRAYGLQTDQLEAKIANTLQPIVNIIIREIKRTIGYYQTQNSGQTIRAAILTGGGAGLPGLASFFTKELGIEIQQGNPLQKITLQPDSPIQIPAKDLSGYTVALGLAMKDL